MEKPETAAQVIAGIHTSAEGTELQMFCARYDASHFDTQLFRVCGIDCPPHIVRSVRRRQAEFFYGRLCARMALESIGFADFTIQTGTQREPIWPTGVIGSISHNDEYAVAIALPYRGGAAIGIDVERLAEGESLEALTATVISAPERAFLESLAPALSYSLALTIVFSAKESFYKAFYPEVQRFFDFDAVEVIRLEPVERLVTLKVKQTLSTRLPPGAEHRLRYEFFDGQAIFTFLHCAFRTA